MFTIAINALYTTLRRRGTTRQLAGAIVTCVVSALLLLAALEWYNQRFSVEETAVSATEVGIVFVYVVLWGWLLPLSTTIAYCLLTLPRTSHDSMRLPVGAGLAPARQSASSTLPGGQVSPIYRGENKATSSLPPASYPSHTPATPPPFAFAEDTSWGWLEYRNGRLQGQQLALTQAVVKLGRGEDNDIWLDDEKASRYHAELAWSLGNASITSREGLVLLNGQPIYGPTILRRGDMFEVGSQLFLFAYAEQTSTMAQPGDPLQRHRRPTPITPTPVGHNPDVREAIAPTVQGTVSNAGLAPARLVSGRPQGSPLHLRDDGDKYHQRDEYATIPSQPTPPLPVPPASKTHLTSGPVPLRLPSKPKKE